LSIFKLEDFIYMTDQTTDVRAAAEAALAAEFEDVGVTSADGADVLPAGATAAPPRRRGIKGRRSSIEGHPDQARIERDLAVGVPLDRIAKKYRVSRDAAWRHKSKLSPALKAALAGHALAPGEDLDKIRVSESESLLANLAAQRARLLCAQDMALEAEQLGLVAQISSGIHRNLELVGKYLGEFAQHSVQTSISIMVTPEYLQFRAAMLRALGQFPEARHAVAAELHRLEHAAAARPASLLIDQAKEDAHAQAG
jgi:hypothetical protein